MQRRTIRSFTLLLTFATLVLLACDIGSVVAGKPTVVIASPPSGSQFREGEDVAVQSTSTDSSGITRVELVVDGTVVRTDPVPAPQVSYPLIQTWKATAGAHTLTVRAYNTSNNASDPAAVTITVLNASGQVAVPTTIASVETPEIPTIVIPTVVVGTDVPGTCTNNAAYVSDVTVPDGTVLAPGQTFNKIWRMRNNGTCAWESGYQFVFVGGEAMSTSTSIVVPYTGPGATADMVVPMTAPTGSGTHTGQWRMKASGTVFGTTVTVNIKVQTTPVPPTPTRTPSGCSGNPNIASFTATNTTITAGASTTLQWGAVTNANSVEIDQGIGGVGTPGEAVVSPGSTTTYTMTARCGSNTVTRQVTVTVGATPIVRCFIPGESGEVIKSTGSYVWTRATEAGDNSSKNTYRSFFSFDIADVAGKTIDVGNLAIGLTTKTGNPFSLGELSVDVLDYGTLDVSDYAMTGTTILGITTGPSGQYPIKPSIQSAVSASKSRLQLRFRFFKETNEDAVTDSLSWDGNTVCLNITYH